MLEAFPKSEKLKGLELSFDKPENKVLYSISTPVGFLGHATTAVPFTHEDFAAIRVLTYLLSSKYLHAEIREKGGAYGSGVSIATNGMMNYYSYHDPN